MSMSIVVLMEDCS